MKKIEQDLLWTGLNEIAEETNKRLRPRLSNCFLNLYNDWLDLWMGIHDVYPKDEPLTSLVAADLFSLGKELHWMHRLLHWGNYPLIYRNLRFVWELMFLAYFADTIEIAVPEITDAPGPSIDAKISWLKKNDRHLNWRNLFRPLVAKVVEQGERRHYSEIWANLNRCVHASMEIRERMTGETALAMRDGFDRKWAHETCWVASDIFDVIWLIVLRRFPLCIPLLRKNKSFLNASRTQKCLGS